ncbi:MAG TPA: hypothetical protein VIR63_04815 [Pontiella sp.]
MDCMAYTCKHWKHSGVIIPATTPIENLPKEIRHEMDMSGCLGHMEVESGQHLFGLDGDTVLHDIQSDGYHLEAHML